jgi:putative transcriptional regulator
MTTALKPDKGKLLVAEPSIIGDISFTKSVILIAEHHNEEGTIGFILNKPLQFKLTELISEIKKPIPVFNGGPVEQDNLYFIHRVPQYLNNSTQIADDIYWGGDFETVVHLINKAFIKEKDIKFFLGYSGWGSNQLEQELTRNSWIVVENNYQSSIIEKPSTSFWKEKMIELGGDYLIWSNAPENPIYN